MILDFILIYKLSLINENLVLLAPKPDTRVLQSINESSETNFFPSLFTWTFQHCSQIVSLTMRIMLTKQIETSLASQNNIDDLKKIEKKIESLIDFYTKHLIYY